MIGKKSDIGNDIDNSFVRYFLSVVATTTATLPLWPQIGYFVVSDVCIFTGSGRVVIHSHIAFNSKHRPFALTS